MTTSEQRIQAIREETEQIYQRIAKSREESDAEIAELRKETEKITRETRDLSKENERRIAELTAQTKKQTRKLKEQTKQMKEQGRQLGDYGNKFGAFTETLAQPSLRRILKKRFDAHYEDTYSHRSEKHGEVEIDAWGVARNGTTVVYLIEIKSRFRPEHLRQVWRHVDMFRALEPEYRNAPVYPILAVVEIDKRHRELVWDSGIYLIDVADGVFELAEPPVEFEPFGHHGAEGTGGGVQRAVPSHLRLVPKAAQTGQRG
ncbi:MAG: hypothetical protein F4239_05085 [Gammaproteobacteria bacterium]|nr:hypothetical protein [Gammaproteobacteria bacterium]